MKPYGKTYRARKDHKATECGICSEQVEGGAKSQRQEADKSIVLGENEREDKLQREFNKEADFQDFCDSY